MKETKIETSIALMALLYRLIMTLSIIALLGAAALWRVFPADEKSTTAIILVRSYLCLIPAALAIFAVLTLWRQQAALGAVALILSGLWLIFQLLG